jgi:hypothetical protein
VLHASKKEQEYMAWDSFQEPPGGQGPYIEYGPYPPVQAPVFPYGAPGSYPPPGAGGAASGPLPLREAIKQLPSQYKKVLTKPGAATFAEEMGKAKWDIIWAQLFGYAALSAILSFLLVLVLFFFLSGFLGPLFQSSGAGNDPFTVFLGLPLALLGVFLGGLIFILVPVGFFFGQGITYLLAKAFGGHGTFLAQAYTALLYQIPIALITFVVSLIPFLGSIGSFAASIYMYVLQAFSLMAVHRLSGGKAAAVVIIPVAVSLLLGIGIYLIFLIALLNNLPMYQVQPQ